MEREKPRSRKKKRLGVKFWAAVCGGIAVAAAATVIVLYIQTGKQYRTVFSQIRLLTALMRRRRLWMK